MARGLLGNHDSSESEGRRRRQRLVGWGRLKRRRRVDGSSRPSPNSAAAGHGVAGKPELPQRCRHRRRRRACPLAVIRCGLPLPSPPHLSSAGASGASPARTAPARQRQPGDGWGVAAQSVEVSDGRFGPPRERERPVGWGGASRPGEARQAHLPRAVEAPFLGGWAEWTTIASVRSRPFSTR